MTILNQIGHQNLRQLPADIYLRIRTYLNEESCWRSFKDSLDGIYHFGLSYNLICVGRDLKQKQTNKKILFAKQADVVHLLCTKDILNVVGLCNAKIYSEYSQKWSVVYFTYRRIQEYGIECSSRLGVRDEEANRVETLITRLAIRGMTIHQFVECAHQAKIGPILRIFDVREPLRIIQHPFPGKWCVTVGDSVSIELRATGSPPPQYQWFKDDQRILNANGHVLHIPSASLAYSGMYKCEVRNNHPEDPVIYSNPVEVSVSPAKPLVIKEHPCSYTVSLNGNAWLTCEVWGEAEDYQWMRNGKEVTDTDTDAEDHQTIVSGSNTHELKFKRIQSVDWAGCYCCRVSRGEEVIFTKDAVLQVDFRSMPPEIYTASDKVALLMGAQDYRSEPKLEAPQYDVRTMATIFRNLNFKVVALMDLNKKEMLAAIHEFKYLVGEDVYCVFYFCGHGFEASGQCYLLPPDAPLGYTDSDCVSADVILFNDLLPRKPKLCCMILDICRLKREGRPEMLTAADGQYVVCYGTSQGAYAYEQNKSGILVSHLKNILQSYMGVEEVFITLREEIKKDPILNEVDTEGNRVKQAPEIRTNLYEPRRSFHDEIKSNGHTQAFEYRQEIWERSHRQPEPRERIIVNFPNFDVIIRLDFQAEFSNSLTIFCSVVDPGLSKICKSHVCEIPMDIAEKAKVHSIQEGTETSLCRNYLTLHIQRLRDDMLIKICVVCILHDGTRIRRFVVENLGLPLVAHLRLWRDIPDLPVLV